MDEKHFHVELSQVVPEFLSTDFISKLAYIDERIVQGTLNPERDVVILTLRENASTSAKEKITEKVLRMTTAFLRDAFQPKAQLLEDHLDRPTFQKIDPTQELLDRRELFQESNGVFVLGPLLSRLIAFFEKEFLELAITFNARPYRFPTLVPGAMLERVNYFHAFPHSLSFATHLREDLDVIQEFSKNAHCQHDGLSTSMESFSKIQNLLSPAVCYHLYFSLADSRLTEDHIAATAVGNCFRYESTNLNSLERLWNFSMREIIFIGSKDYVLEQRELGRHQMAKKLEAVGMAYKVESANDPFFIGEYKQAAFQNAFHLKYEIRALLPYKNSTLAVGSYNYHQDFFGRQLKIQQRDGSPIHTGCLAFGLERIAFAFLSQFGLLQENWPSYVKEGIE
jgi:seryl-tRNA synthetase